MSKLALALPGDYSVDYPAGFAFGGGTIGAIINAVMPYVFGVLGFIFLFVLIWGGFDLLTSGGNPEKVKAGQAKIINGLIGFLVVLGAYWIIQALQVMFGIKILG